MDSLTRILTLYNLWTTKTVFSEDSDWLLVEAYLDVWARQLHCGHSDREVIETIKEDLPGLEGFKELSDTFGDALHACLLSAAKDWLSFKQTWKH